MWAQHLPNALGALHGDHHHCRKFLGRWAIQNSRQYLAFTVSKWCTRYTQEVEFQGQPYVSSHLLLGGACKGPCGCRRSLRGRGNHAGSLTPAVGHVLRDTRQAKDTGINLCLRRSNHSGKADPTASALRVTSGLGGSLPCDSPGNDFHVTNSRCLQTYLQFFHPTKVNGTPHTPSSVRCTGCTTGSRSMPNMMDRAPGSIETCPNFRSIHRQEISDQRGPCLRQQTPVHRYRSALFWPGIYPEVVRRPRKAPTCGSHLIVPPIARHFSERLLSQLSQCNTFMIDWDS